MKSLTDFCAKFQLVAVPKQEHLAKQQHRRCFQLVELHTVFHKWFPVTCLNQFKSIYCAIIHIDRYLFTFKLTYHTAVQRGKLAVCLE